MSTLLIEVELQGLNGLYQSLEEQLELEFAGLQQGRVPEAEELASAAALAASMCQADRRIASLSDSWQRERSDCPEKQRTRVESLAAALQQRAGNLLRLVRRNAESIRRLQDSARTSLREVGVGAQYLHSVRSMQEREPRFIDAHR